MELYVKIRSKEVFRVSKKKLFSIFSGLFFVLGTVPLLFSLSGWEDSFYVTVINISLFLPLIFSILGLVFAFIGIKGKIKLILVLGNLIGLIISLSLLFFVSTYTNQP